MKICIISSLNFTEEIFNVSAELIMLGHQVTIPPTAKLIEEGKVTTNAISNEKVSGKIIERIIKQDSFKQNYYRINDADCVLALNYKKNGIENYIGGSTFLELGFAYILNKKIFIFNDIPEMSYTHEIMAMQPIILNKDLSKIN